MIELREVYKTFNPGQVNEYQALRGIDLALPLGRIIVLKGPSGSGKTTLLSVVGCMARPTAGRLFLNGRELSSLPERFLAEIRRRTFGFIFQSFNLVNGLSVFENVVIPTYPLGENPGQVRDRAMALLARFRIESKVRQKIEHLSGGEKQRVAIARALINSPEIIIADEPTAHLDSKLAGEFLDIVADLGREGRSIVIASHDALICDAPIVDQVVAMRDGKVVGG